MDYECKLLVVSQLMYSFYLLVFILEYDIFVEVWWSLHGLQQPFC